MKDNGIITKWTEKVKQLGPMVDGIADSTWKIKEMVWELFAGKMVESILDIGSFITFLLNIKHISSHFKYCIL
jgi:hypothetical protein